MQSSKVLLRGGGIATGVVETKEIRRQCRRSNADVGGFPSRPVPASPAPSARSPTRADVSTRASSRSPASSSMGVLSRSRLRSRRSPSKPSSSPSSTPASTLDLSPAKPAALRASDSDDPSDDDDPASELTAEELAMALSDDVPPPAYGEEDDDDDDDDLFGDDAVAAASAPVSARDETEDDARALAVELARVASGVKATDVVVLHVAPLVYWTSYMVLCTVFSRPQLGAVLAKAEEAAAGERFGRDLGGVRAAGRSPWEVLDFGDVVMHCFTPDQREFYDLEGFYGAAEEVELPFEGGGTGGGGGGKRDASSWARRG